jgi:NDP-4-keto-2,6-dideoxyhexose 3-C-methyltransferase
MSRYSKLERCRICGSTELTVVLDLGEQFLTGVFPRFPDTSITAGPMHLVKCQGSAACGLLQLAHTYDLAEMYGDNYGYRSGLNASMVAHLQGKVRRILDRVALATGDLVLDIGSNDSTTLQAYPQDGITLVGMDPSAGKFRQYYPSHVALIEDFFSAQRFLERFPGRKARVVTSFAMFYDLEEPMKFMREVHEILADDGIWVFEQSYMPTMLGANAYDTVCHEHLEFYGLYQIQWMADRVGFRIVDVEFNDTNGGSFSVTVAKSPLPGDPEPVVQDILDRERNAGLHTLVPYQQFAERVAASKQELTAFVREAVASGKTVAALGASTKGNVLLQYCGFTSADIFAVGEVNPDKFGAVTPGTWLPIVSEEELLGNKPDYLLVLPWHFRKFFVASERFTGTQLVFPLPTLEVVSP